MAGRLSSLWLGTWRCVASSSKLYNVSIRGLKDMLARGGERHLGCEIMYFFILEACLCIYDSHIYTWKKKHFTREEYPIHVQCIHVVFVFLSPKKGTFITSFTCSLFSPLDSFPKKRNDLLASPPLPLPLPSAKKKTPI